MTHKSQSEDTKYKNWVKGGLATKYLKEGLEPVINYALLQMHQSFLSDVKNFLSVEEINCTKCTTANCLPCPTSGICNITRSGKKRVCSYHVKDDPMKQYQPCKNRICDSLHQKVMSQHKKGSPTWRNTDATQWCSNPWQIGKCFLPVSGYTDKASISEVDCSGLLHIAINCLHVQKFFNHFIPSGKFSQILDFRNELFHSASLSLTTEQLDENIDLIITVLQDQQCLDQDPRAQNAFEKLTQLKNKDFNISTQEISEVQKDRCLQRKKLLQTSLCSVYEEHFRTIPVSPLLDEIGADIDDVFAELVICDDNTYTNSHSEYTRHNGTRVKDYTGIFYKDNKRCKNIYVLGDAGMGKTTWSLNILRNWVSALNKSNAGVQQNVDNFSADEMAVLGFDIVLFVSLRHAEDVRNVRDMISNQLFEESLLLDGLTSEVLETEPSKCLVILDGLDEWSCPDGGKSRSALQHPALPGRKSLNGCTILTTSRPWKLNSIRLQTKDIDIIVRMQGVASSEDLVKRVIEQRNKHISGEGKTKSYYHFENEFQSSFKKKISEVDFVKIPLILIFMVCMWLDGEHLEKTWAGNFTALLECMIMVAEKDNTSGKQGRLYGMEDLNAFKIKSKMSKKFLPNIIQERGVCVDYSQLFLQLAKLAFYALFDLKTVHRLVFTEKSILNWLTKLELEVALKIGILSQSKVVGKALTRMSSLSFLHKTVQEFFAAIYMCSDVESDTDALTKFKHYCDSISALENMNRVVIFINGMNVDLARKIAVHVENLRLTNKLYSYAIESSLQLTGGRNSQEFKTTNLETIPLLDMYAAIISSTNKETMKLNLMNTFSVSHTTLNTGRYNGSCLKYTTYDTSDAVVPIYDTARWLPRKIAVGVQLRAIQLLHVNNLSASTTCIVDLSHCQNLEIISFEDIQSCHVKLNISNLGDLRMTSVINVTVNIINESKERHSTLDKVVFDRAKNSDITIVNSNILYIGSVEFKHKCESCYVHLQTAEKEENKIAVINDLEFYNSETSNITNMLNVKLLSDFHLQINNLFLRRDRMCSFKSTDPYINSLKMLTCRDSTGLLNEHFSFLKCLEKVAFHNEIYEEVDYGQVVRCGCCIDKSFLDSINSFNQMKDLTLTNVQFSNINQDQMQFLSRIPTLEKLKLSFELSYLSSFATESLMNSLQSLINLQYLHIAYLPEMGYDTLSRSFVHLSKLETLEILFPQKHSSTSILISSLKEIANLKELSLNGHFAEVLMAELPNIQKLEKLKLRVDSNVSLLPIKKVINLRELYISLGNSKSCSNLADSMPCLKYLEKLSIGCRSARDIDNNELMQSIKYNGNVKELFISDILKTSFATISDSLCYLKHLEKLELRLSYISITDCNIGHNNIKLTLPLNKMIELRIENLCTCICMSEQLAKSFQYLTGLETLNLSWDRTKKDTPTEYLSRSISNFTQLRHLKLKQCNQSTLRGLMQCLTQLTHLVTLELSCELFQNLVVDRSFIESLPVTDHELTVTLWRFIPQANIFDWSKITIEKDSSPLILKTIPNQ